MKRTNRVADGELVDVGGRRRRTPSVGVSSRSSPSSASSASSLVRGARGGRGASASASVTARHRSIFGADVLAVQLAVLGVELAVDVGDLAHEHRHRARPARGTRCGRERGKSAAAASTRARTSGSACSRPRDADRHASSDSSSARRRSPARARAISSTQPRDVARHRPDVVEARREREDAVDRHEPVARLEAGDPAARGRDADRAAGVGPERRVGEPERERRRRAAARPAGGPAGRRRVRHRPVVEVLRGDRRRRTRAGSSCRRSRSPAASSRQHGLGAAVGHVLGEDGRPVGRPDAGRVEEVLDREPDPVSPGRAR